MSGEIKMEFEFSKNLGRTIDLSRENFREYIRGDIKYLIKPFILLLLIIPLFFGLIIIPAENNSQAVLTLYY